MQSELPHPRRSRFAPIFQRSVKDAEHLLFYAAEPLSLNKYTYILTRPWRVVNEDTDLIIFLLWEK